MTMAIMKTPLRCWQYQGLDHGQLVPMWAACRLSVNWDEVTIDCGAGDPATLHKGDWVVEVCVETEKTEPDLLIYGEKEFATEFVIVAAPAPVASIAALPRGETRTGDTNG